MVLAFDGLGFILSASLYVAGVDREATGIHLLHDRRRLGGGALALVAAQGLARGGEPGRRRIRGVLFVSALFGIESLALAVDGTFWRPADAVGTIAWIAALAYAYWWLLGRPAMRAQFAANEVAVETAAGRRFATIVLTLAALIAIVTARTELAGRRVTASRRDALAREQSEHAARIAAGEPAIRVPFDGSPADAGPYHFPVTVGGLPARFEPGARGQAIVLDGQTNWIELDPYLAIDARVSLRAGATLEVRFAPDDATASVAPAPMELATVSGGGTTSRWSSTSHGAARRSWVGSSVTRRRSPSGAGHRRARARSHGITARSSTTEPTARSPSSRTESGSDRQRARRRTENGFRSRSASAAGRAHAHGSAAVSTTFSSTTIPARRPRSKPTPATGEPDRSRARRI